MADVKEFLDKFHIEDLQNPKHPSVFTSEDAYDLFILRLPLLVEDELKVESFGFVITGDCSYHYDKKSDTFIPFADKYMQLHRMLDREVDQLMEDIIGYDEAVASMEDRLYDNALGHDYMEHWFGMKKNVARMERVLFRSLGVLKRKIHFYEADSEFPRTSFHDLVEHVDRAHRDSTILVAKLDNIYSFYNTRTSEKINSAVYYLTIISAIFLPLNLVVGFFGMNTSGLPYTSGSDGTSSVVFLMLFAIAMTLGIVYIWKLVSSKG